MLVMLFASALLLTGRSVGLAISVALFSVNVVVGLLALTGLWISSTLRGRRSTPVPDVAAFVRGLAAAIRGGATLRIAIAGSRSTIVSSAARRLAVSGAPMGDVGRALAEQMPVGGERLAAMCDMSERTGGSIAPALDRIATACDAAVARNRRRRIMLAQTRLSAWVVGVAPLAITATVLLLRGVPQPGGAIVVLPMAAGVVLQVIGLFVVFRVSRRAGV